MKKIISAFFAAALLCSPLASFGQTKLLEKVTRKGKEVVIPYEKYSLPNGLTVIIHEDHSDPIVHVDVTYHVGSAREEIGKSGFAHFFEHMMFQGSDNVADEQHFKIITEAGGTLNGTTNRDRTNYFETVPGNQLEKMLWLEADRMGFLLDAVTQEKFEVQRSTVKNERGQRYDNVPYGLVSEVAAKNLFSYGHPYSWLTIGYIEDLNRVNVQDLKNFFMRWYGPNNAVLTVGGDVNTQDVLKMIEKYFGSIPPCPKVTPTRLPLPKLDKDRYVSMMDNYAKQPQLRMVFPVPPAFDKDEAALDCFAEIFGQGKNSILYKNLVKTQKAVNASAFNSSSELSGEFNISVSPFPGQKLADMEKALRESLIEFETRGVTDEDIEMFRSQQESRIIRGLENVSAKVSQLAYFQTFTGDANFIGKSLERNLSVTKADVMRVYNQYLKGKHALILSVLTKENEDNKAAADNYKVNTAGYQAPDYGYNGLKYIKAKDNFDRSKMPGNGPNPVVNVPKIWRDELPGNIKIIGTQTDEIPVVNLQIKFKGGRFLEAADPSKAGLANMVSIMMDEDTKNHTAEAFSNELDKLGSSIDVFSSDDALGVNVQTLTKNLDKTMALLEERLLQTVFTEEAFERNKKRQTENIRNAMNRPNYVAGTLFPQLLYGKDNVLGWNGSGTEYTVGNISLIDVENFYKRNFSKQEAEIIVVGDVNMKTIVPKLYFLEKLPGARVELPPLKSAPPAGKTTIYFVNVPKAAQTEFRIGYVTNLKYDAVGDYFKAGVMSYPLGGMFNSRLNLYLREEKGWTYGARGNFNGDKYTGTYEFSAGIRADATDSAVGDIIRIMKDFKAVGLSPEELAFTKSSMGQSDARKYESGLQKAGFLSKILDYDLSDNFTKEQNALLENISLEEVNKRALRLAPDTDNITILLVGDKERLWSNLQKMGYPMVELDKDGNRLN